MSRRLRKLRKFWSAIELLPQWTAVRAEWRWLLGAEFDLVASMLRPTGKSALSYPRLSAEGYGIPYRIIHHDDDRYVGVAEDGQTVRLTRADVILHELPKRDLLRTLGCALGFNAQPGRLEELPIIWHVGSVVPGACQRRPVYFACAPENAEVRRAVENLTARHQEPFVLLVPTPENLSSEALALLDSRRSVALILQDVLGVDEGGQWYGLQPTAQFLTMLGARMAALAEPAKSPAPVDVYKWARQIELVKATNQVLGEGLLNPGVLSKACSGNEIATNKKAGRGLRIDVKSFIAWLGKKWKLRQDEMTQVRNAVIGEILERN